MSADNGIYIIKTKRTALESPKGCWTNGKENFVYRVAHTQAIDNLDYYVKNQTYNLGAYLKDIWGQSEVFTDKEPALAAAHKMADECPILEYGVQMIDLSDYIFYGDV